MMVPCTVNLNRYKLENFASGTLVGRETSSGQKAVMKVRIKKCKRHVDVKFEEI